MEIALSLVKRDAIDLTILIISLFFINHLGGIRFS